MTRAKRVNDDLSICPRCGNNFHCSKSGKCWCYEVALPVNALEFIEENYESCLCPSCLNEFSKQPKFSEGKFDIESLIYAKKKKL